MKYIRTKDGIYELMPNISQDYEMSFDGETLELAYYTIDTDWIAKKDVINQADIIEELCDVYVIKGEFGIYLVHFDELDSHAMGQTKEMLLSGQLEAYGAIWIINSDGAPTLKPVAKANKKGELKLL